MKIGIVVSVNQSSGGIYQYTASILEALFAWDTDIEFTIFIWPNNQLPVDKFNNPRWKTVVMNPDILTYESEINVNLSGDGMDIREAGINSRARSFFSQLNIDLLIYPAPQTLSFECGIPYIMAIHDLQHRLQPEFPEVSAGQMWKWREYLFRNGVRYSKGILTDSITGKEDVMNFYGQYIDEKNVHPLKFLAWHQPDRNISQERKKITRIRYQLPPRFLFYPAQFWMHKNHTRLVHAIHQTRLMKKTDIPLVLAGSNSGGPKEEARDLIFKICQQLILQLGLKNLIYYLGYAPDEEMPVLYSMASALAMPTFFGPTNIPVVEAWAFECPVLTSDIRGIREQVENAGLLVDPNDVESISDGLFRIWKDDELRASLIIEGKKKLNSYTKNDFQNCLYDIINKTAGYDKEKAPEYETIEKKLGSISKPLSIKSITSVKPETEKSSRLRLYFYNQKTDFNLPQEFCYTLMPLLYGTDIEESYRYEFDHSKAAFDNFSYWKKDLRWIDFSYDQTLFEIVKDPLDADYYIFPYLIDELVEAMGIKGALEFITTLPYFRESENKHVFMTTHDNYTPFNSKALFFRMSINKEHRDANSFCFPYSTHDYSEMLDFEPSNIKYDTCFVGYTGSSEIRPPLIESIKNEKDLSSFIEINDRFFGYLPYETRNEQKKKFFDIIKKSKTVLCPKGAGINTFRFFETMSMGRIPVLVSDTCALPFEEEVDYKEFVCRIPEKDITSSGIILKNWLKNLSSEDIIKKCRKSREIFNKYLKCSNWQKLMIDILSRQKSINAKPLTDIGKEKMASLNISRVPFNTLTELKSMIRADPKIGGLAIIDGIKGFLDVGDVVFLYNNAQNLPPGAKIAEIGSFMGLSSFIMSNALLCSKNYNAKIFCIDTWEGSPEHKEFDVIKNRELFEIFLLNIENSVAKNFVNPIKKSSHECASDFCNDYFDMIYIDGDHSFEGCYKDLKLWFPKLKDDGIFIGHDCTPDSGVYEALIRFVGETGLFYKIYKFPETYYMFEIFRNEKDMRDKEPPSKETKIKTLSEFSKMGKMEIESPAIQIITLQPKDEKNEIKKTTEISQEALKSFNRIEIEPTIDIEEKKEEIKTINFSKKDAYLVSAIVSVYKSEKYITGCLQDLINQTIFRKGELEIVLVNTASPHDEDPLIKPFIEKYGDHITYIKSNKRKTVYGAWNIGIKASKGTFITNSNTDDRHRRDALEAISDNLLRLPDEYALVYADLFITENENETFETAKITKPVEFPNFDRNLLFTKGCYIGPQPMWRKSIHSEYGYFDESFVTAGDLEFWLRITMTKNLYHLNEFLGLYYKGESSIEHSNLRRSTYEVHTAEKRYPRNCSPKTISEINTLIEKYTIPYSLIISFKNTNLSPFWSSFVKKTSHPLIISLVDVFSEGQNEKEIFNSIKHNALPEESGLEYLIDPLVETINDILKEGVDSPLFVVSSDIILSTQWLEKILSEFEKDKSIAVIGPSEYNKALTEMFENTDSTEKGLDPTKNGYFLAFSRTAWRKTGRLMENVSLPIALRDYFKKAKDAGFKLATIPGIFVPAEYIENAAHIKANELSERDRNLTEYYGLLKKGKSSLERNDFKNAETAFLNAATIYSENLEARSLLAETLQKEKKYDEAESLYRDILKEYPNDYISRMNYSKLLWSAQKEKEAIIEIERAALNAPADIYLTSLYIRFLRSVKETSKADSILDYFTSMLPEEKPKIMELLDQPISKTDTASINHKMTDLKNNNPHDKKKKHRR